MSIIIPVYNTEKFLKRCIDSILSQKYHNYELILVNDGSTDKSGSICDSYASQYSQIQAIHKKNEGPGAARNAGLTVARGQYLFFIDSDDWIEERTLIHNSEIARTTEADIIVFGYKKRMVSKGNRVKTIYSSIPEIHLCEKQEVEEYLARLLEAGIRFSVWNKFFKKSIADENKLLFPDFSRVQDIDFTVEYYRHAHSMYIHPQRYYVHENIFVSEKYDKQVFKNHLTVFEKIFYLFPDWLEKKENFGFVMKLFLFWFLLKIPKIVSANSSGREAHSKIKEIVSDNSIQSHAAYFASKKVGKFRIPLLLILNKQTTLIFYWNKFFPKIETFLKKKLRDTNFF